MLHSLKSLSGQSSRLLLLLSVLMLTASCSKGPLSLLTGGGPNVAANIQAGKTNSQTLGTTKIVEQKTESGDIKSVDSKVSAETVDKVTVNETQPWVILLLILGWLLPNPNEIGRWVTSVFKRQK
jgi:hypothetical protein